MSGEKMMVFPIVIFFVCSMASFMTNESQTIPFTLLDLEGIATISFDFTFSDFIWLLTGASAIIAVLGIGILASGLGSTSILIVFKVALMAGLWFFLSGLSSIAAVPYIGTLIFWTLSLIMFLGIAVNVGGG